MLISRYKKTFISLVAFLIISIGGFFYFQDRIYFSHGRDKSQWNFIIEKGEGSAEVATRLENQGFVSNKFYFIFYVKINNLINKIMPGEYELSGSLTIPEIVVMITRQKKSFMKITFQEGWDSKKIAERLTANGFDGDGFLNIVKNPGELKNRYYFLQPKEVKTLDGYLFPDTYFFTKESTPEQIVEKILGNFNTRITVGVLAETEKQNKSLHEIITMASIIEKEANIDYVNHTSDDLEKTIAGIFWKRIEKGQPLQSCATLAYILGENKKQYSFEDTRVDSPYNTYLIKGLPPGPISNSGIYAIQAAMYPNETDYNYFLSENNHNIIFSKTIDEHNANKVKYGL